ncbi:hypothetical protein [Pseudomonas matsuisoli]|uniref:Uncharacterized protein n=1 Tax=Pseudomonas matsuisoli TaxID=1515666 RepID=A0A917Q2Q1_9PSED|nr:hypothetical protein [Pseudomonas matsuisoli]GGK05350.1 hypothetical protein GCM10009304_34320 [Pseudomonas matsuisoli]
MKTPHSADTRARIRELRILVDDLQIKLADLEADEQAQHEEIDQLDDYIHAVDTQFTSLQLFWITLKAEWLKSKR